MYDHIYHFRSLDVNDFPDIVRMSTSDALAPEKNAGVIYGAVQRYLFGGPTPPPKEPPNPKESPNSNTSESNMTGSSTSLPEPRKHLWKKALDDTMFYI